MQILTRGRGPIVAMFVALCAVAGCSQSTSSIGDGLSSVKSMVIPARSHGYRASAKERECLARAMFFESNRSSREGLVAVGSVVMNRRDSGKWGDDICDVVGAKRQFAPGVLSRPMNSKALPDVMAAADDVLKGERHPEVTKDVMFFHTAGLKFPYKNMRYTTVAGGNAFYYKASRKRGRLPAKQDDPLPGIQPVMVAQAEQSPPEASTMPEAAQPAAPVQAAYAGDTPAKPVRTSLFGKRKAKPMQPAVADAPQDAEEARLALADEAPIPMGRVEPQSELDQTGQVAVPSGAASTKLPTKERATPQWVETAQGATSDPGYEAPSDERFGGAMPAYADTGLSAGDGMGTGVLGQMSIEAN